MPASNLRDADSHRCYSIDQRRETRVRRLKTSTIHPFHLRLMPALPATQSPAQETRT